MQVIPLTGPPSENATTVPAVIVRGLEWRESTQGTADGLRDTKGDLFK